MNAVVLTDTQVEWLIANHNKYPLGTLAKTLEVGVCTVRRYLKTLGLGQMIEKPRRDVESLFEDHWEDILNLDSKINAIKKMLKPGMKVGPYIIIKSFPHHCQVQNIRGRSECVEYQHLCKFVKFTTPIMRENIK